jgi:hypothetical protein
MFMYTQVALVFDRQTTRQAVVVAQEQRVCCQDVIIDERRRRRRRQLGERRTKRSLTRCRSLGNVSGRDAAGLVSLTLPRSIRRQVLLIALEDSAPVNVQSSRSVEFNEEQSMHIDKSRRRTRDAETRAFTSRIARLLPFLLSAASGWWLLVRIGTGET